MQRFTQEYTPYDILPPPRLLTKYSKYDKEPEPIILATNDQRCVIMPTLSVMSEETTYVPMYLPMNPILPNHATSDDSSTHGSFEVQLRGQIPRPQSIP